MVLGAWCSETGVDSRHMHQEDERRFFSKHNPNFWSFLSVVITSCATVAAVLLGIGQNTINRSLLELNYRPSLYIAYATSTNNFILHNFGKENLYVRSIKIDAGDNNHTLSVENTILPSTVIYSRYAFIVTQILREVEKLGDDSDQVSGSHILNVEVERPDGKLSIIECRFIITYNRKNGLMISIPCRQ